MIAIRSMLFASVFAISPLYSTPSYAEEGFTVQKFLEWNYQTQANFFQTSITMAGVVFTDININKSKCVSDWYFEGEGTMDKRNQQMLEAMVKYPDYHPSGVIMAFINKACGSIQ